MFWSLENIFIFYYYIWHDLQDISIDMCHILFSTYIPWIEYAFYSQLIPFYSIHYFTWITGTENQWLTYLVMSECNHLDVKLLRRVWLFAIPYTVAYQKQLSIVINHVDRFFMIHIIWSANKGAGIELMLNKSLWN